MLRPLALVVLLAFAGCSDANAQLADLVQLEVTVSFDPYSTRTRNERSEVTVHFEYDDSVFSERHGGDCAILGDTRATFDGVSLELVEPGHYSEPSIDCVEPRFRGLVDPAARLGLLHGLKIEDASSTVYAAFGPGTAEPRYAELLTHDDWHFTAGETVAFAWSHEHDLALPVTAHYFLADGTGYDFTDVQVVGSEIHVAIPTSPPLGRGHLEIMFGKDVSAAYETGVANVRCDNAFSCRWTVFRTILHEAMVD